MSSNTKKLERIETLLHASFKKRKIAPFKISAIEKLAGDASSRNYFRVSAETKSLIACLDESEKKTETMTSFLTLQRVFSENQVRVPFVYDEDLQEGFILQEDVGDVTLLRALSSCSSKTEEFGFYKKSIDELIKIQRINTEKYKNENFYSLAFDAEKLMWEVRFTCEHFIEQHLGKELSTSDKSLLFSQFQNISEKLAAEKRVLTHRDYHSKNIMVKEQDFVVIDFQDGRMGIPQYDLVSLLADCYYSVADENVEKLKKYYWEALKGENTLQRSFDKFEYYYDLMLLQRTFKAIGSFAYIYATKKNKSYLHHVGFSFERLRKTLHKYSEYSSLGSLLCRIYYGS